MIGEYGIAWHFSLKTKLPLYNAVYLYTVCVYMLVSRLTLTALSIIIHSTQAFVSITNLTMTNAASPWWRASPHYWMSFGLLGQTNRHTRRQAAAVVSLFGSTHCSSRSRWKKIIFHCRANPPFHLWSVEIKCSINELTWNEEEWCTSLRWGGQTVTKLLIFVSNARRETDGT